MEDVEKYCKTCGIFIPELDSGYTGYCDECNEEIDTVDKLKGRWVAIDDERLDYDDLDKEIIEEFERELSYIEEEICNVDNELLEYFKECEYSIEKYEKIRERMEKIKRILKVD